MCISEDNDRRQTDRRTRSSQYSAPLSGGGVIRLDCVGSQDALTRLRVSFSSPKVLHLLRCSPSEDNPALQTFDSHLRSATSKITNSSLSDIRWLQASMPVAHDGLGCEGCHRSQFLRQSAQNQISTTQHFLPKKQFLRG